MDDLTLKEMKEGFAEMESALKAKATKDMERLAKQMSESKRLWWGQLTEREQKEVQFAQLYAKDFSHGTDGHNRLLLIAKLVGMLDEK